MVVFYKYKNIEINKPDEALQYGPTHFGYRRFQEPVSRI